VLAKDILPVLCSGVKERDTDGSSDYSSDERVQQAEGIERARVFHAGYPGGALGRGASQSAEAAARDAAGHFGVGESLGR
jgi:hypothetical protein